MLMLVVGGFYLAANKIYTKCVKCICTWAYVEWLCAHFF